jgi:hypothetical protein
MLSSFPSTFVFGMAFGATPGVTFTAGITVDACVREESDMAEEDLEDGRGALKSQWPCGARRCSTVRGGK